MATLSKHSAWDPISATYQIVLIGFFIKEKYGGILTDIGSHNFDQFLHFTGSTVAEIVSAQISNFHHPEHPELEDFGDVMVRGDGGTGYIRVDWFTPDGLGVWGDGRLFITGTDGYIELRKYIDITGRPGGEHLFLVDQKRDTLLRFVKKCPCLMPRSCSMTFSIEPKLP